MKRVKLEDVCDKGSSNIAQKDIEKNNGEYPIYGASGLIKEIDFYKQESQYIAIVKDGAGIGRTMLLPKNSSVISTMQYIFPKNNINIRYLYYALQAMNLSKYYSGVTIPHIYFKDYKNETLYLPSIEEQIKIATKLDRMQEIIDMREKQIEELNKFVNSQFMKTFIKNKQYHKEPLKNNVIQMFIGPFGSSLKNECFVNKEEGFCVVYEQKNAIHKNMNNMRYINEEKYNELKRFEILPNDIIVSCRGTIGKTYLIPENAPLGIMHPSIMKIRLNKEKYNPVFFELLLESYFHNKISQSNGATIKMAIKAKDLEKELFIIPKLSLQNEFVSLKEKVDKAKLEIQKNLEEMQKLQESLMNQYFKEGK